MRIVFTASLILGSGKQVAILAPETFTRASQNHSIFTTMIFSRHWFSLVK